MGAGNANNLTKVYEIETMHYEWDMDFVSIQFRGERERLFGSREREGKLKIVFPVLIPGKNLHFPGTGREITRYHGKGREI